jgi:hypothetical protein
MKMNIKLLAVLALFLVAIVPSTMAADDDRDSSLDNFWLWKLDLDDEEFERGIHPWVDTPNHKVEMGPFFAGDKVHVKLYWGTLGTFDDPIDVKLTVELDDEEAETEFFTVKDGWMDRASFVLDLPKDMDTGYHTLHIEIEDEDGNKEYIDNFKLEVVNQKHFVEIYDVNFPHSLEVKAGQAVFASVGVKNLGHEMEEDVKVSVSVPQLGLYQRSQKFDLLTEEEYDDLNDPDDDEDYKMYKDLYLLVPENTVSGVYDLIVKVEFDDGDKTEEQVYSLIVGAGVAPSDMQISIDTEEQTFAQGSGAVYTVMFSDSNDYNINVEGVNDFGTYMVNKEGNKVYIFVTAEENVQSGSYPFSVKVMSGSAIVKEFDLTANVTAYQSSASDIKEGLQIGFAVLLVILIILGIILAAKKIGKSDNYEEPLMDEGETYY